jgi:hypothetical protein
MRKVVEGFTAQHGHTIVAERQTWLLVAPETAAAS